MRGKLWADVGKDHDLKLHLLLPAAAKPAASDEAIPVLPAP
jgi:hypothetical protein